MGESKNDEVGELIAEYRKVRVNGTQDEWEKVGILDRDLYPFDDPRIKDLFLEVAADAGEFQQARIGVLKILGWKSSDWDLPTQERRRIADVLIRVMLEDEDDLVRNYAGQALHHYPDVPGVLAASARVLLNPSEDGDLRSVALGVVRQHAFRGLTKEVRDIMRGLLKDEEFQSTAERELRWWEDRQKVE